MAVEHNQAGSARQAEAFFNRAAALHGQGRLDEAIAAYRQAVALKPDHHRTHCNLGIALQGRGRFDEAIDACRRALDLRPDLPEAFCTIGSALAGKGRVEEAIGAFRQAIGLRADYVEAHANLGLALLGKEQFDEAVAACRRAVALEPGFAEAHLALGKALAGMGKPDEAVAAFHRAIALRPNYGGAYTCLGTALKDSGRLDEAVAVFNRAIAINPSDAFAHCNLATALRNQGRFDEAVAASVRAIELDPGLAEAHANLGMFLLSRGEFARGWAEYEWRWKRRGVASPDQPRWNGGDLNGRTILLYAEQGFGDSIQFVRYVPQVRDRGGKVILMCETGLHRLLEPLPGVWRLMGAGEPPAEFDVHCPLLSLPHAFGTRLESIPNSVPYLSSNPQLARTWSSRLCAAPGEMKVGLAWAGVSSQTKSMNLKQLARLADVERVRFFSLQKGPAAAQARGGSPGLEVVDFSEQLTDFAETAALIANLDLVISVDTSVGHLAGAMGKPVWLMLPFVADWRWLMDREDCPWYPTMRLFRQPAIGDWDSVIKRVAAELRSHVGLQ